MARYILTLDPATYSDVASAQQAITDVGAEVIKSFHFNLTFLVECSLEQKTALAGVLSSADADAPLQVTLQVLNSRHLNMTLGAPNGNVPAIYDPLNRGAGQHIYLVDTGIRATHEQFTGVSINNLYSNFTGDAAYDEFGDTAGHGTMVASVIAGKDLGAAKDATLHNVKLFDSGVGTITVIEIINALNEVLAHHLGLNPSQAKVVCLPWGTPRNAFIDGKILEMNASNLVVIAAAGNDSDNVANYSPAGVRQIITVGAHDSQWGVGSFTNMPWDGTDAVATYSNYGAELDIFAMGVNVYTATATNDTSYSATGTGTSMSAGITAGVTAQYVARYPTYNSNQIKDVILQEGHIIGSVLLAFDQTALVNYAAVNKSVVTFDSIGDPILTNLPSGRIASVQLGQAAAVSLGINSDATEVAVLDFAPLPPWVTIDLVTGNVSIDTSTLSDPSLVPGSFLFAIKGKINNITKVEEFSIFVYNTLEIDEIDSSTTQYYYDAELGTYDPIVQFQVGEVNKQ